MLIGAELNYFAHRKSPFAHSCQGGKIEVLFHGLNSRSVSRAENIFLSLFDGFKNKGHHRPDICSSRIHGSAIDIVRVNEHTHGGIRGYPVGFNEFLKRIALLICGGLAVFTDIEKPDHGINICGHSARCVLNGYHIRHNGAFKNSLNLRAIIRQVYICIE